MLAEIACCRSGSAHSLTRSYDRYPATKCTRLWRNTKINVRLCPTGNHEIIALQALSSPLQNRTQKVHTQARPIQNRITATMSLRGKQNKILAALTTFGVLVAANYYFKPPVPRGIAFRMNRELDQYNATPHPEQDPK